MHGAGVTLFVVSFTVGCWATPIHGPIASAKWATEGRERQTIAFLIDGNTRVEGQLHIGSQATVEGRSADGRNVAIHIVVAPAADVKPR